MFAAVRRIPVNDVFDADVIIYPTCRKASPFTAGI